ncbi:hypothetical protein ABZ635_12925 [Nocardiopsis sp. NPDC007018]|uniref:hypothetical protein n=1 Tax=Nocardiopsis sp. NPDC007018 TaxID=3155721 RepID=UPI0033E966AD
MTAEELPRTAGGWHGDRPGTPGHHDTATDPRGGTGRAGERDGVPPPPPGTHENRVDENHGQAVNVGVLNGDVNLHERPDYREFLGEVATRRLRHAAGLGADRIREVRLTFRPADPEAFERFVTDLEAHGLGLITGEPGSGRTHTAIRALAGPDPDAFRRGLTPQQESESSVDEIVVDPDSPDAGLAGITLDSDRPRLLDLTVLPAPDASQRAAVRTLMTQVRTNGARLVVVARPGVWENELVARRARLRLTAQPHPEDVFAAAMRRLHGADPHTALWTSDDRVRGLLAEGGAARAVRFVREVDHTRPPYGPSGEEDHQAWLERALKSFTEAGEPLPGWRQEPGSDGEGQRTEYTRALIQTVALLEGASAAVIAERTRALADSWGVAPRHATPVSGEGFSGLLEEIGAHLDGDHVRFDRGDHARDALDHLWREHPEARSSYQRWADEAVAHLPRHGRIRVADRWLDLARRHRDASPVLSLLYHWGLRDGLTWAAVPVVAEAAVSAELGPEIRSHLYRIATTDQPTSRHVMVLEACRVYGRLQPTTALTRLRHIADRLAGRWTENLDRALVEITAERGNLPVVLEAMPDWLAAEPRASAAATRFLTSLLGGETALDLPRALERGHLEATTASRVWVALHRHLPGPDNTDLGHLLWTWVDALAGGPRSSRTVESLSGAARAEPAFAEDLARCVRRWTVSHTRASVAVDKLRRSLTQNDER